MSNAVITNETLTLIANAIRMKGGASGTMKPSQMPSAIAAIPTGTYTTKTITQNGVYNAASDNVNGYSSVTVSVLDETFPLLWTNNNSSSSFAAQTISIDLSDYDAVIIDSKSSKDVSDDAGEPYVTHAYETVANSSAHYGVCAQNLGYVFREVAAMPFGVVFRGAMKFKSSSGMMVSDDTVCIPIRIYGVRGRFGT